MSVAATLPLGRALARPARRHNKWLITVSITFGTLMGTIDSSIINVALPHIRGSVGASVQEITWISTAYIIASVMIMPLTGFLGRTFGQKRVYMTSLALFVIGSLACGMASSLTALVVVRALQGFGAGALQPTEQAILRQTFPPEEQGMAMAVFAMAVMIGPTIGPTLGGLIIDNYSWPWIFYINLPVGILGLFMVWRFVDEPDDIREANRAAAAAERDRRDWAGIGFLFAGIGALQFVLEEGSSHDWFDSRLITVFVLVAITCLIAFVIRELTAEAPAVDLRLFKDPTYLSGSAFGAVMFAMLMGSMFLLPLFTQELLGYSATRAGLLLMPRSIIMIVATPIVGRLYNRVHPALTIAFGVVLFAVGSWQFSHITLETSTAQLLAPLLITGVAFSCLFVPLTTAALSVIPRARLADAAGLNSLVRQIGGSIGLTIFATLLGHWTAQAHLALSAHLSPLRPEVAIELAARKAALIGHGLDPTTAHLAVSRAVGGAVARQASVLAFEKAFLVQGIAFVALLPLLFFLRVDRKAPAPKAPAHLE